METKKNITLLWRTEDFLLKTEDRLHWLEVWMTPGKKKSLRLFSFTSSFTQRTRKSNPSATTALLTTRPRGFRGLQHTKPERSGPCIMFMNSTTVRSCEEWQTGTVSEVRNATLPTDGGSLWRSISAPALGAADPRRFSLSWQGVPELRLLEENQTLENRKLNKWRVRGNMQCLHVTTEIVCSFRLNSCIHIQKNDEDASPLQTPLWSRCTPSRSDISHWGKRWTQTQARYLKTTRGPDWYWEHRKPLARRT